MIAMKRPIALAGVAALALGGMVACSPSSPGDGESSDEPATSRTLEILTWTYDGASLPWWEEVNAKFEDANPGVTVEVEQSDFGAIISDFVTQATAGQTAAVIHIPSPVTSVPAWAEAGFLVPLSDWLDESGVGAELDDVQSAMDVHGDTYGLVFAFNAAMYFYNEGWLADAGLEVPTTPDEMVAVAHKLTEADLYGFGVTDDESVNFATEILSFIIGMDAAYVEDGDWNFSDPAVVEAVDVWRTLATEYAPRGTTLQNKRTAFDTGNIAAMFDWAFYHAASLRSASPDVVDEIRMAVPPLATTPLFISQGFGISSAVDEETQELGKEWLEFAMAEEAQSLYAELEPVVPTNLAAQRVLADDPATAPILEAIENGELIIDSEHMGLRSNFSEFREILNGTFRSLLQNDADTAEAMVALDEQLRAAGLTP